jgi:hypothetical protein
MASNAYSGRAASARARSRSGRSRGVVTAQEPWRARVHDPRIADVEERVANITRATKRIKSDVTIDIVRACRGR